MGRHLTIFCLEFIKTGRSTEKCHVNSLQPQWLLESSLNFFAINCIKCSDLQRKACLPSTIPHKVQVGVGIKSQDSLLGMLQNVQLYIVKSFFITLHPIEVEVGIGLGGS